MKKKLLMTALSVLLCLSLTACGTTLGENTGIFFKEVGEVIAVYTSSSSSSSSSSTTEDTGEALASVTDFTVTEDGDYSFTGNEEATYYIITICDVDATEDEDTYLYSSSRIEEDGSGTYTGNVFEMFTIPYGEYLVKCFAYPEIGDEDLTKSAAEVAELGVYGELADPQIEYFWDIFTQTLSLQLGNISDYTQTCLPDSIDITIAGADGSSQTLTIESPTEDNIEISTSDITEGTYTITAVAYTTNECATNSQTAEVTAASDVEFGIDNVISDAYSYTNTGLGHGYSWPVGTKTFDPTTSSSLGAYSGTDFFTEVAESTLGTTDLSVYSFTFTMAVGFGETGWMELYSDGTCAAYNDTSGPVSASSVEGTWYWNEDGTTITINWNMSSVEVSA